MSITDKLNLHLSPISGLWHKELDSLGIRKGENLVGGVELAVEFIAPGEPGGVSPRTSEEQHEVRGLTPSGSPKTNRPHQLS